MLYYVIVYYIVLCYVILYHIVLYILVCFPRCEVKTIFWLISKGFLAKILRKHWRKSRCPGKPIAHMAPCIVQGAGKQ